MDPLVSKTHHVTQLIDAVTNGDSSALETLLPVVYDELRAIAEQHLRSERSDHTLQPTALVHEAYLKLVDQREQRWQNRAHFFAVAALAMRRILVNHAKSRKRIKRGGGRGRVPLDDAIAETPANMTVNPDAVDLEALDAALTRLAEFDDRKARVVELRYFSGLGIDETGEVLGIAPATVKRDWNLARAWLLREMQSAEDDGNHGHEA
ncbi:MAG TPA: sigma-70 family RNA polymerase sigma factor [Phycisphaerales bacterium]|nr:sigma-70 family RNA polymerase sigma factor [Phycisphaerales bacterium]